EQGAGGLAGGAVEQAVALARDGVVDAIVTGPVHKHALHVAGFRYPGLTELVAHLAGGGEAAMMLATGKLRVVLVTTHIALKEVPAQVTTERVLRCGRVTERALAAWWGIARPRLALCALNPHAGESGLFGDEDDRIPARRSTSRGRGSPIPARCGRRWSWQWSWRSAVASRRPQAVRVSTYALRLASWSLANSFWCSSSFSFWLARFTTTTAPTSRILTRSTRPFSRNVRPVSTRSTIQCARPSNGATSTDPATVMTSTPSPVSAKKARVSRGYFVATRGVTPLGSEGNGTS